MDDDVARFARVLPREKLRDLVRREVFDEAAAIEVGRVVAHGGFFHGVVLDSLDRPRAASLRVRDDGSAEWRCDECDPHGFRACEHVVAIGLHILDHGDDVARESAALHKQLESMTKAELIDQLLRAAFADPVLMDTIRLSSAARCGELDPAELIAAIDRCEDLLHDEEVGRAVEGLEPTLRAVAEGADPDVAVKLLAYAVKQLGSKSSRGERRTFALFAPLHVTACGRAKLGGAALARHLWALTPMFDIAGWGVLAAAHRELLGDAGIGALVGLAEKEAAAPPKFRDGPETLARLGDGMIQDRLVALAALVESPRCLADVRAKWRLKTAADYHDIAAICAASPRGRDALLEWARKGLRSFPSDEELLKHALEATAGSGRESIEVLWAVYDAQPSRTGFAALRKAAIAAKAWDEWRDRAIRRAGDDPDLRTHVLIEDEQIAAAWDVALGGRVASGTCLELASWCGEARPAEAVAILQRDVELKMSGDEYGKQRRAAEVVEKIRTLMALAKPPLDWPAYVRDLWAKWVRRSSALREALRQRGITAKDGREGDR